MQTNMFIYTSGGGTIIKIVVILGLFFSFFTICVSDINNMMLLNQINYFITSSISVCQSVKL